MSKQQQSRLVLIIALSCLLSIGLLAARISFSGSKLHMYLVWNLFLAGIPFFISHFLLLKQNFLSHRAWPLLVGTWLLFLPNAPYIVTDLTHLGHQQHVPMWYDPIMMMTFAWNGMLMGLLSLFQVELFLKEKLGRVKSLVIIYFSMLLCGYGVYLGRFSRWNSWDIVSNPFGLVYETAHHLLHPMSHPRVYAFTVLFSAFILLAYLTLKSFTRLSSDRS